MVNKDKASLKTRNKRIDLLTSKMDLSIFKLLRTNNQEEVNKVTSLLNQLREDPNFISWLITAALSEEAKADDFIMQQIIIAIHSQIRAKWTANYYLVEEMFWTAEDQEKIAGLLFDLLFTLNESSRRVLAECISFIAKKSFPDIVYILERLFPLYDEHGDSIEDMALLLEITYTITYVSRVRINASTAKQKMDEEQFDNFTNIYNNFLEELIERLHTIAQSTLQALTVNDDAAIVLLLVTKIIKQVVKLISTPLIQEPFLSLFPVFFEILKLQISSEPILRLKSKISQLILSLNEKFLTTNESKIKKLDENEKTFMEYYKTQLITPIVESILIALQLPLNFSAKSNLLFNVHQLFSRNAIDASFVTPEFISTILIPGAYLSEYEIPEFENTPPLYLSQNLAFELLDTSVTYRTDCSQIVSDIVDLDLSQGLYQFLVQFNDDLTDLEAKVFLLSCLMKYDKKHQAEKREKLIRSAKGKERRRLNKEAPKPFPIIQESDLSILLQMLDNDISPCLHASILMLLTQVIHHFDAQLGIKIAQQVITNSQYVILNYFASRIYLRCKDALADDEIPELDYNSVLTPLLETANILKEKAIYKMITSLCEKINTTENKLLTSELINVLIGIATTDIASDDPSGTSSGARSALDAVYNIINDLNDDDEYLIHMSHTLIPEIIEIFVQFPENEEFTILIHILSHFSMKITQPIPEQLSAIDTIISLAANDEVFIQAFREITWVIYPYLTTKLESIPGELLQKIFDLTDTTIKYCLEKSEEVSFDQLPYAFFLASCLIMTVGSNAFYFANYAIQKLNILMKTYESKDNDPDIDTLECDDVECEYGLLNLVGAFVCLFSVIYVSPETGIKIVSQEIKDFIEGGLTDTIMTTYREIKMLFTYFLILAKYDDPKYYLTAASYFSSLIEFKHDAEKDSDDSDDNEEEDEEEDEKEEEEEEEEDDLYKIISPAPIPFDDFDEFALFNELTESLGLFGEIEVETQAIIHKYYTEHMSEPTE